jgi:hypothetical protein
LQIKIDNKRKKEETSEGGEAKLTKIGQNVLDILGKDNCFNVPETSDVKISSPSKQQLAKTIIEHTKDVLPEESVPCDKTTRNSSE